MSLPINRIVSFHDSFKAGRDWGLTEEEFEILKKKKIKVLMAAYECHSQSYCNEYVIFKIETPKLKNKFMIIYDRFSLDGIVKYLVESEIDPENGKFVGQTDEAICCGGIIVKKGKGRIMKFMDCMFKRNIYNEVNSGEFQMGPPDTKTTKINLNCSIFDEEFYNMLSKRFNVLRFDDSDSYFAASNGVPNHHSLSKNVVWKKYCRQTLISNVERKWDPEKRVWTGRVVNNSEFSRLSLCGDPFTE